LREAEFPESTIVCRRLRLKDSSLGAFLTPPDEFKIPRILELIDQFPLRRFLLVGDSGEKDPEIYGSVARQRPDRIVVVLIRSIKSDDADTQRWSEAFRDLEPSQWQLFREPHDLDLAKWI
jgi:phosphatidate phosphatase APP1